MRALLGAELPGYRTVDTDTWLNDHGDVLSLHFFDLPPDLLSGTGRRPHPPPPARPLHRSVGGGLIEASVKPLGELPALRQILKLPLPNQPSGQAFIGSFTVPRAGCSTVVKIQAAERGMTGMREAVVMARLGPDQYFRPHPYAPELQGGLPFHAADHVQWDADFPDHPLTRVRRTLDALAGAVTVEPGFAALPPFTGPVAPPT